MLQIHNLCDGASYQSADKDNQLIRITCLKVPPTCQLRPTLLGWTIRLLLQVIWANFMLQVVSKINARSTAQSPKTWTTENWNCKTETLFKCGKMKKLLKQSRCDLYIHVVAKYLFISVSTTTFSIGELSWPSITICGQGRGVGALDRVYKAQLKR